MTENPAVKINNLGFSYPAQSKKLFDGLSLDISEGESFGLFGPNGAGKTTLMSLMTGLIPFNVGDIKLLGNSVQTKDKKINKLFGFVPQDLSFYEELTPVENLEFFGAWAGLASGQVKDRTDVLLGIMGLEAVKNMQVRKLSGGMKRRVNLAIGVIHQPRILFLDEPTVGVDVQTRRDIIDYLKELNANGTTLIYTSHQLNEAEALCKRVALIDNGRIIAYDYLDILLANHQQDGLEGLFLHLTGKDYSGE